MNRAGLHRLLDKIRKAPSPKLIERYVALLREMSDVEAAAAALELAKTLIPLDANEGMRIAHLVFKDDPMNIEALDIMIECLKKRGRHGKVEVLKNERNKLARLANEQRVAEQVEHAPPPAMQRTEIDPEAPTEFVPPAPQPRPTQATVTPAALPENAFATAAPAAPQPVARQPVVPAPRVTHVTQAKSADTQVTMRPMRPTPAPRREEPFEIRSPSQNFELDDLNLPELELGNMADESDEDGGVMAPVDRMFVEAAADQGVSSPMGPEGTQMTRPPPAAPAAVAQAPVAPRQTMVSQVPPVDIFEQASTRQTGHRVADGHALPRVAATELGVAVELFDYCWQQGYVDQARDLLAQTAAHAGHQPWWQARNDLIERSPAPATSARPPAPAGSVLGGQQEDFWQQLVAALPQSPTAAHNSPEPATPLPEAFVAALIQALQSPPAGADEEWRWNILQGVFGPAPRPDVVPILEQLQLQSANPGFWGMYLDGLIAAGQGLTAWHQMRETLAEHPHLPWARVAAQRLTALADLLACQPWQWTEDDGVPLLRERLERRPQPTLKSYWLLPTG